MSVVGRGVTQSSLGEPQPTVPLVSVAALCQGDWLSHPATTGPGTCPPYAAAQTPVQGGKGQLSVFCANADKAGNGGWVSCQWAVGGLRPPGVKAKFPTILVSPAARVGKGELTTPPDPVCPLSQGRYPQGEGVIGSHHS